jgi:hypothetical protein
MRWGNADKLTPMHVHGTAFYMYLPTWQPLHLLVLDQIPGENKRIMNQPPKVLAAGFSPKKKERDTVLKGAFTTYSRKVSLNQ